MPDRAIPASWVVDGSRCISYFTIELKEEIPQEVKGQFGDWVFGCDICQDGVRGIASSKPHQESRFEPDEMISWTKNDWKELTEETFNQVFKNSPLKRSKWKGLQRNIDFLQE